MKVSKLSSGKIQLTISKSKWQEIGKNLGWTTAFDQFEIKPGDDMKHAICDSCGNEHSLAECKNNRAWQCPSCGAEMNSFYPNLTKHKNY